MVLSEHVNASHGLDSDIFAGLSVIVILRLKLFRLFLETAERSTTTPLNL